MEYFCCSRHSHIYAVRFWLKKPLCFDYIQIAMFHLLIIFACWVCTCLYFHISCFYFYTSISECSWKNCCTYVRLRDFFSSVHSICVLLYSMTLWIECCSQQLIPKIFTITLLSMQVRALQIRDRFTAIVLFFSHIAQQKACTPSGASLDSNGLVGCCDTWDGLFVDVLWNSVLHSRYPPSGLSTLFLLHFVLLIIVKCQRFVHLEVSDVFDRALGNQGALLVERSKSPWKCILWKQKTPCI